MAKSSGLGDQLLVGGNIVGGDVQSYNLASPIALIDSTDITQSAHSRITGLRDASGSLNVFFDPASGAAHDVFKALPTADTQLMLLRPAGIGNDAACLNAKQIGYDPTRSNTGELMFKVDAQANGFGLEWGDQLTPGVRTDTTATNGATFDAAGGASAPAVPASTVAATNPANIPATVVISGGTVTNVSINGVTAGSGDGTYTVPNGGTIAVTYSVAPTWTWSWNTGFGGQGYLQVAAFTGSSVTVTIQHSADNSAWSSLAAFTAVSAAPAFQRIAVSNTTTVNRYLRVATTGTFTNAVFAVSFTRNVTAGVVF